LPLALKGIRKWLGNAQIKLITLGKYSWMAMMKKNPRMRPSIGDKQNSPEAIGRDVVISIHYL
jgi:hypothetical protein